jgi:hypothetical protein
MKRYFLHPNQTLTKDGDYRYVTATELARLNNLEYRKCHVIYDDDSEPMRGYVPRPDDVHLYPS